jgi:DNA-binding SARP family transcriptional activator
MEAACAAARIEPLSESVQQLTLRAHLVQGNRAEALRAYRNFSARLREEFGVAPSARTAALLEPLHGK